jgi:hypothetical protein
MPAQKTFTLFHLNLVPIEQLDIETISGMTREQWLRHALSTGFDFPHWGGGTLHWVPNDAVDECILGLLERTRPHEHHRPPEEGGGEIVSDEWQAAYALIDPTHHDEGQRVAIENDVVGKPIAMLKSLVAALNARKDRPYHIEIEPLFDASRFWAFSRRHGDLMRRVTFNFVVPNMWGTESDLEKDLKETGKETGAQRVAVGLSSDDGVHTENDKVREGVSYSEKGAGTINAVAMDGARFSSTKRPRTSSIPGLDFGKALTRAVFLNLKEKILGRE